MANGEPPRPDADPAVNPAAHSGLLERLFRLRERSTTVGTELRAGLVTFLTMAYILLVNPQILAAAGMPPGDVVFATAVGSAVGTLAMALLTNYPFALAPGMGINAYFAYSVVGGMKVSWQVALTAVFVSGLLFMALSAGGLRTLLLRAIPDNVKLAIGGGIGLFLALIGFENAGLVQKHPVTMITLGDLHAPAVLLALGALLLMAVLLVAAGARGAADRHRRRHRRRLAARRLAAARARSWRCRGCPSRRCSPSTGAAWRAARWPRWCSPSSSSSSSTPPAR